MAAEDTAAADLRALSAPVAIKQEAARTNAQLRAENAQLRAMLQECRAQLQVAADERPYAFGRGSFTWRGSYDGDFRAHAHTVERSGQIVFQQRPHGHGRHTCAGKTREGEWCNGHFLRGTIQRANRREAFPVPDVELEQRAGAQASIVLDPDLLARVQSALPQTLTVTILAARGARYWSCRVASALFGADGRAEMKDPQMRGVFVGQVFTLEVTAPSSCSNAVYYDWPFYGIRDVPGRGDEGGDWSLRAERMADGWRVVTCRHHRSFCAAISPHHREVAVTYDGWRTNVDAALQPNAFIRADDPAHGALWVNLGAP